MVNIFFTDWDPLIAARDSCDKYVIKIPVEVATLLSAIHWRTGYRGEVGTGLSLNFVNSKIVAAVGPYKDSRTIKSFSEIYQWLVKSQGNYNYAVMYGLELIEEYKKRYVKLHRTEGILIWLKNNKPDIKNGPMTTDVSLAMPDIYKDRTNPTKSYKNYLIHGKSLEWRKSTMPDWYNKFYSS